MICVDDFCSSLGQGDVSATIKSFPLKQRRSDEKCWKVSGWGGTSTAPHQEVRDIYFKFSVVGPLSEPKLCQFLMFSIHQNLYINIAGSTYFSYGHFLTQKQFWN